MMRDPALTAVRYAHFARRMAALSLVTGVLVALLAPLSYLVAARAGSRATSQALAGDIAADITELAIREPYLWRYNVTKIVQATSAHGRRRDLASAQIIACDGAPIVTAEELGFAPSQGPRVHAEITSPAGTIGFVEVVPDTSAQRATAGRLAIAGGVIGALLGWMLMFVPSRVVRRQYAQVERAGTALRATQAELEETNAELEGRVATAVAEVRALSEQAVRVQEAERNRIARDLHDTLGQQLTAQRLELDGLTQNRGDADDRLARLHTLNATLIDELRRTVHDLRPAALEGRPLTDALTELAESFELRSGITATTRFSGLQAVGPDLGTMLFRIAQEALTNVLKHANASEVSVRARVLETGTSVNAAPSAVILEVVDDGTGGAVEAEGHGLRFMRHRAALAGGTFEVRSGDEGTVVVVTCPLEGGRAPAE